MMLNIMTNVSSASRSINHSKAYTPFNYSSRLLHHKLLPQQKINKTKINFRSKVVLVQIGFSLRGSQ